MKKITDSRIGAIAFERLEKLFFEEKPVDNSEYVRFFGLLKAKRVYRWFRKDYFKPVESFEKYKVLVPAANGSGVLGEVLSSPIIGMPYTGHTETFLSTITVISDSPRSASVRDSSIEHTANLFPFHLVLLTTIWTDKMGKRHEIYAKTLDELRRKESELTRDIYEGIKTADENLTVNDIYKNWLTDKKGLRSFRMF